MAKRDRGVASNDEAWQRDQRILDLGQRFIEAFLAGDAAVIVEPTTDQGLGAGFAVRLHRDPGD